MHESGTNISSVIRRLLIAALLLAAGPSPAGPVTRLDHESAADFAARVAPSDSVLAHEVLETSAWGSGASKGVIAFHELAPHGAAEREVVGYAYLPSEGGTYEKLLVRTFEPDGGDPRIESVFFAPLLASREKLLFVIVSWPQRHYDLQGTLYATYVFRRPRGGSRADRLDYLEDLSAKLEGGCECEWRDGTKRKAKYRTAEDVKAALRRWKN